MSAIAHGVRAPVSTMSQSRRSPIAARIRAALLPASLDRQLANGAEPRRAPELALRARRVTGRRHREGLATGFERLLEAAKEPSTTLCASAPLRRAAILRARHTLLALAGQLRCEGSVSPRGVVLANRLLTDPAGPLYTCASAEEIERAARAAAEAL